MSTQNLSYILKINMKNWSKTSDNKTFFPKVFDSTETLPPGMYRIKYRRELGGISFNKMEFNTQHLISFSDTPNQIVLNDIDNFWKKKELFEKFNFPYKRGILLEGIPGSGKSCALAQISQDIVKNGGYVIKFDEVGLFVRGVQILRSKHKDAPIVCIMEDLDQLLETNNISEVLNLLDGIGSNIENIVYLATTNQPEELQNNIKNRPSRFDRRITFKAPSPKSRKTYIEALIAAGGKRPEIKTDINIDIDQWVNRTRSLTFAHLKELFVSVICFGRKFEGVIDELQVLNADVLDEENSLYKEKVSSVVERLPGDD